MHCIFCGQWAAASGMQQIFTHALHSEAVSRCHPLGLRAVSPCLCCGTKRQQPRRHLQSCSAVYQASLAQLHLQCESRAVSAPSSTQDSDGRGRPTLGGSCGSAGGVWRVACPGLSSGSVHGERVGTQGSPLESVGRSRQDEVSEEGRVCGQRRQDFLASPIEAEGAHGGGECSLHFPGSGHSALDSVDDALFLRHEGELSHLRREMGRLYDVRRRSGLLVSGCPEAGSSEVARALCANKVTSSLGLSLLMGLVQTLWAKLEELLRDDACSRPTRAVAGSEMASTPSHRCGTISSGARQGRRSFSLRRHHFHMPESWRSYGFC